jgi:hypothetical protein
MGWGLETKGRGQQGRAWIDLKMTDLTASRRRHHVLKGNSICITSARANLMLSRSSAAVNNNNRKSANHKQSTSAWSVLEIS